MSAKKNQPAVPVKQPTATKAAAKQTSAVTPKAPAKPKAVTSAKGSLKADKKRTPKNLDRLYIPGMSENVPGFDAGIPKWLFESGVTIQVDKNWVAAPGDIISVGKLDSAGTVVVFATKELTADDIKLNNYFFSASSQDLPDGKNALVYVVHYAGGAQYDQSYPLEVLVKTDIPAGDDQDQIEPGHSALKFSLSETVIVPGNASRGVTVTLQLYPNLNPTDRIILHWGSVIITQQVGGAVKPTVITVTYQDIVEAGDSDRLLVWLEVIDLVGNISTPGSASMPVSVNLDVTKYDGPVIVNAGPLGYVDLEVLNEQPLEVQMYTPPTVGLKDDLYDVMFRSYPPKGGVKVVHQFVPIRIAGRPVSAFFDFLDVRAAAEGRLEISFVLRKAAPPFEIYSKKTTAEVKGSIFRLEAPTVEGYPDDHIHDNPEHVIVNIPYYAWRQPTDRISLILRYVKSLNDIILHIEEKEVGPSWPERSPVQRLLERVQLQQFKGYRPELYYVISTGFTQARAVDLNESLRRALTIS